MVADTYDLQRFVEAQDRIFETALAELQAGNKQTHWMWFIFPQLAGLGRSSTAQYYGIRSPDEAHAYLSHDLLGPRLRQSVGAVLPWAGKLSPENILGQIDSLKFRSCLTLFDRVEPDAIFDSGLRGFFDGKPDERTLALLNAAQ